jgi:hypothetical protein
MREGAGRPVVNWERGRSFRLLRPTENSMRRWEYASLEWIWQESAMRLNLPGGKETFREGTYSDVVDALCALGKDCWEVVGCVAEADWIYWTLKRPLE